MENLWKQKRQIKVKRLEFKQKEKLTVDQVIEFLTNSKKQLEDEGLTVTTWYYDNGYDYDGYRHTDEDLLAVVSERPFTDDEQAEYEFIQRGKAIKLYRDNINKIQHDITRYENQVEKLTKEANRHKDNPNAYEHYEAAMKGVHRCKQQVEHHKQLWAIYSPMLEMSDDEMAFAYKKQVGLV